LPVVQNFRGQLPHRAATAILLYRVSMISLFQAWQRRASTTAMDDTVETLPSNQLRSARRTIPRLADGGDLTAFDGAACEWGGGENIRRILSRQRDSGQRAGEPCRDHDNGWGEGDADRASRAAAAPIRDAFVACGGARTRIECEHWSSAADKATKCEWFAAPTLRVRARAIDPATPSEDQRGA
jgi:hypothetical protein